MNRRQSIGVLLSIGAANSNFAVHAQAPEKRRKVGVLMPFSAGDPIVQPDMAIFEQALAQLGWRAGSTIAIEYRWEANKIDRVQSLTRDLTALRCDVIVSRSTFVTKTVARDVKTVPIVFLQVSDPVGDGIVLSMARPGANVTGFTNVVESMSGKWVELLKAFSPEIGHTVRCSTARRRHRAEAVRISRTLSTLQDEC